MQVQSDAKPYDDINITPMLDLAYVLLVIFIIMTTATVQGMKVNLPKASASPSLAQQTTKAITVTNDGKIFLDTIPVTLSELRLRLLQQKALTPGVPGRAARRFPNPIPERHGRARPARPAQHHASRPRHQTAGAMMRGLDQIRQLVSRLRPRRVVGGSIVFGAALLLVAFYLLVEECHASHRRKSTTMVINVVPPPPPPPPPRKTAATAATAKDDHRSRS